jgi:hypothetical protein
MMSEQLRDPRWDAIAREWLEDCGIPDDVIARHVATLAQSLHNRAEDYVNCDLPDDERLRDEAAHDAHVDRQIDELRGK